MPVTVRVSENDHKELQALSAQMNLPMGQVLHEALGLLRRHQFWQSARDAYAALHADTGAWEEEQAERAAWDHNTPDPEED